MIKRGLLLFIVSVILFGCHQKEAPRVDASSMSAFEKSTELMANSLETEEEKRQFSEAIMKAGLMSILENGTDKMQIHQSMMERLDKKTAKEIIEQYQETE